MRLFPILFLISLIHYPYQIVNAKEKISIFQFEEVISHFDGNNNDKDDIAALPIAAALINSMGLQRQSTFFYNNNIGEPNNPLQVEAMRESAAFAEKLGIDTYDYQESTRKTTNKLIKILESGKKVLAIEGGPMEAIYRGLEKTSPRNRRNITLISHSSWNETRDIASKNGVKEVRTWADIKKDFPEVTLYKIKDQNGADNEGDEGFYSSKWHWLDDTDNPILKEARRMMRNAQGKVNDPSDAGMHFYLITGIEDADPENVQRFFARHPPKIGFLPNFPFFSKTIAVNAED